MIFRFIAAAAFLLSGLHGVATADTIKVEHASGTTDMPANPAKVLVYDLGALENLDQLGIPVAGVPDSNVPLALQKYRGDSYAKVGSLFEPDLEAVNAAEPDLIIVAARSSPHYAKLAAMAPTIDLTVDDSDLIGGVKRNATIIGEIFGKQADMQARIETLDASIAELRALAPKVGSGLILLTTGGKISAYGKGSRFGQIHDAFGVLPADTSLQQAIHGQVVSYEYILETNPDWLFVVDRDAAIGQQGQSAQALLDNELVRRTRAWKAGHVLYLDPVKLYLTGSGIQSQQDIVTTMLVAFRKAATVAE